MVFGPQAVARPATSSAVGLRPWQTRLDDVSKVVGGRKCVRHTPHCKHESSDYINPFGHRPSTPPPPPWTTIVNYQLGTQI